MTDRLNGTSLCLSAYIGEEEMYEDRLLWRALIEQARAQGCAGATAIQCANGFGAGSRSIEAHGLRMSQDKPVLVQVIDEEVQITALAQVWDAMVSHGLITIQPVEVVAYRG